MKRLIFLFIFTLPIICLGQNIVVDSQTYSPQQLIEDILINSDCIENVQVTNIIGGDFSNTDQSYGYFEANGSTFPFASGIVLSTGRLQNVPGPNTSLSDDDATNWVGDTDLEQILNESNTHNATILEFEFTAVADQISFRYIFASEEYQENNANTCQYSDLFGFLIRPQNQQQYTNIALVPNTNTPVKVTTVHSGIPGACEPINETYFGSWNDSTAPINFNGQTAILTATAQVTPNETYHVKLVIADEQNYRYDSAVFLEAGSFKLTTDLGPDRLLSTNNPLCEDEELFLNASQSNAIGYKWFRDNTELIGETNSFYNVTTDGTYNVEVTLTGDCTSYGEVIIEYANKPTVFDSIITECDIDNDNLTVFNLWEATNDITNSDNTLQVSGFFLNEIDAEQNNNTITNPDTFENTSPNQIIFARVENQYACFEIAEVQLAATYNPINLQAYTTCDDETVDGFTEFDLSDLLTQIEPEFPTGATINIYETLDDVFSGNNITSITYTNINQYSQLLYIKAEINGDCFAITTIEIQVLYTPVLEEDESIYYCLNNYPETITLHGGILNDLPNNYYYSWSTGENMTYIEVNEPGTYSVTVTDPNGCSSSRTITVVASNIATIDDVIVEDLIINNTATIMVSGEGDYEFAINDSNGPYQDSNIFENLTTGFHTVYVRDKIGCGIVEQIISVRGFPKFFTPNDDDVNDVWHVSGINSDFHLGIQVIIFNRYGKLITQLNNQTYGWDGTFNGDALPSDDYWFIVKFSDGKEYRGHFALVR